MNISRIAFTVGASAMVAWASGCTAQAMPDLTARHNNKHWAVTSHYSGRFGTESKWCEVGQTVAYADCEANGGTITDNHKIEASDGRGEGWTCTVNPADTTAGADMTMTVDCVVP